MRTFHVSRDVFSAIELYVLIEPFDCGSPIAVIYADAFVIETDNDDLITYILADDRWQELP